LGALARANQMIIVGDTKQLGPTNFFNASHADDDDADSAEGLSDDSTQEARERDDGQTTTTAATSGATGGSSVLSKSESILQAAKHYIKSRLLMWHYRSRHPKLIAFSNEEFYEKRLVVFPLPEPVRRDCGVHFNKVEGGQFDSRTNLEEARRVVAAVLDHAVHHPEKSPTDRSD
jgi:superfamily I DNA and/or RNA helicase